MLETYICCHIFTVQMQFFATTLALIQYLLARTQPTRCNVVGTNPVYFGDFTGRISGSHRLHEGARHRRLVGE